MYVLRFFETVSYVKVVSAYERNTSYVCILLYTTA